MAEESEPKDEYEKMIEEMSFANQQKRKQVIQMALSRLKKKNEDFLLNLENNTKWRRIYNGLLFSNAQSELNKLISLELCQVDGKEEGAFFNPFEKVPITMCYNKFNSKEKFEQQALYNLVLLYDSRIRSNMNWNDLQQTARSTVRALHISDICKRNNKKCFEDELQKRVLDKQRFKGLKFDFETAFNDGIEDMSPISQVVNLG